MLHLFTALSNYNTCKILIKAGADPARRDNRTGDTAMHVAVREACGGNYISGSLIKLLAAAAAADIDARNGDGLTALQLAIILLRERNLARRTDPLYNYLTRASRAFGSRRIACKDDVVSALLDAGARINAKTDSWPRATALHFAVGDPGGVLMLIERGADVDAIDAPGRSPLHWAAENVDLECIVVLLLAGADYESTDVEGETPSAAFRRRRLEESKDGRPGDIAEALNSLLLEIGRHAEAEKCRTFFSACLQE